MGPKIQFRLFKPEEATDPYVDSRGNSSIAFKNISFLIIYSKPFPLTVVPLTPLLQFCESHRRFKDKEMKGLNKLQKLKLPLLQLRDSALFVQISEDGSFQHEEYLNLDTFPARVCR